uniref:Uncharacterized protein n=1 Tax=Oryza rufipogon TaxID=4529 RepID=A0A0E0QDS7_ORYRU
MRRNNDIFLGQIKRCRRSYSNLQEESKSLSLSFLSFQVGDEPVRDAAGVIVAAMTISEPSPLPSRLIRPPSSTFINISISSQMDSSIHLQIIQEATPKKVLMATTGDAFTLVAVSSVTINVYSIIFDGATTFLTLIMKPLEEIAIRSAAARCLHAVLPERTTDRRSTRGSTLPSCPDPGGLDGAVGDARRAALALKLVTIIMQPRHCHVVFVLADQTLSHCLPEHVGLRQNAIARGPYAVIKTGRDSFSSSSRGRCAVCPRRFHFIMLESFVMSRDHHVGAPLLGAYKPSSSRSRRAVRP